ncbi:WhiB family transcriptional regulator [Streptomyces sp. NPDC101152]|uniref:WhiB family transcriptional regulator n=1 Tax=Streptomyces sp. NPDC101152 TaxID=3366116 RepID=UPI00382BE23A
MTAPRAAACRGADVETFFPAPGDVAAVRRALMICDRCPVRIPCRRYALDHRERYGIWGGLTEETRETLLRIGPPRAVLPLPEERISTTPYRRDLSRSTDGVIAPRV